jgi:transposase-like protein
VEFIPLRQVYQRMTTYSEMAFAADFPTEESCLAALMVLRFGGTHFYCRGCLTRSRFHPVRGRRAYACQACGRHVFPCAGTAFARTRAPLRTWFRAIYLMTGTRRGLRATVLRDELGVTYKTAWHMMRAIRGLIGQAGYRAAAFAGGDANRSRWPTVRPRS